MPETQYIAVKLGLAGLPTLVELQVVTRELLLILKIKCKSVAVFVETSKFDSFVMRFIVKIKRRIFACIFVLF